MHTSLSLIRLLSPRLNTPSTSKVGHQCCLKIKRFIDILIDKGMVSSEEVNGFFNYDLNKLHFDQDPDTPLLPNDFSFYINKAPISKAGNSQYQLESPTFHRDSSHILDVLKRKSSEGSYQMDMQHMPEKLYSFDFQRE